LLVFEFIKEKSLLKTTMNSIQFRTLPSKIRLAKTAPNWSSKNSIPPQALTHKSDSMEEKNKETVNSKE
tara:strand:- start:165 stop:371 length:207 start_codon:yes stop_codon:yes gene_type:complete